MATPPSSGGLFFPSSPTRYSAGPSEEVDSVLEQSKQVHRLDSSHDVIVSTHRIAFFETFARRIELIKSRSQAFSDCHVTVFDKVLLALTQNGNQLDNPAAITYFCEEHLGIPSHLASAQKKMMLSNALIAPAILTQAISPPITQRGSISTAASGSDSEKRNGSHIFRPQDNNALTFAALAAQLGLPMTRLFALYGKEKMEFFAITDTNSLDKQKAAKILRDTCENALQYLHDKTVDQRLVAELKASLAVAKHTAETLHGGKKRKFDLSEHVSHAIKPTPPSRPGPIDISRANARPDKRERPMYDGAAKGDFPGHARALGDHRGMHAKNGTTGNRQQFYAPDLPTPKHARSKERKQKPQPGRGHSGIPFGYTRAVDSYQPT